VAFTLVFDGELLSVRGVTKAHPTAFGSPDARSVVAVTTDDVVIVACRTTTAGRRTPTGGTASGGLRPNRRRVGYREPVNAQDRLVLGSALPDSNRWKTVSLASLASVRLPCSNRLGKRRRRRP